MLLLVIVACCSSCFFLRFRSVFSTWPKGCLRAVGCVSGCVSLLVFGRFVSGSARGARLLQAAFENSIVLGLL
jgi:hypothetical protein